jgi:hypothetical protein
MPHKNDNPIEPELEIDGGVNRRDFMKTSALLGGSLLLAGAAVPVIAQGQGASKDAGGPYIHHLPENQIYSACQQCNTNCGMKVKLVDGRVAKLDGNPYNPWCMTPQIPEETPIAKAAVIEGSLCPKGQSGIQSVYDPYRIVKVLKRAGKRGEGKWQSIPFDQAVSEIVEGGLLFKNVPGEENRHGRGPEGSLRHQGPGHRQGHGRGRLGRRRKKQMTTRRLQGQAQGQPGQADRSRSPRSRSEEQPVRLRLGPHQKAGRGDLVTRFVQGRLRVDQRPRPHHGLPGLALLHRQGDERAVHRRQVDGRQEVLLAGGHRQLRVHHLRRGLPLREQLRPAAAGAARSPTDRPPAS